MVCFTAEKLSSFYLVSLFTFDCYSMEWDCLLIQEISVQLMPGLIFIMQVISERWKNKGEMIIYIVILQPICQVWVVFFLLRKTDAGIY